MLLILFPILLTPATLGGLATGGFLLLIAIVDEYFTPRGSEHLYALVGFAAGAFWGTIYLALLRRGATVRHPRA